MVKKRGKKASSSNKSKKKANSKEKKIESVEVIIKKKILGEAPEEHHFVVADGRKLKNVLELADALHTMSEEVFNHHANDFKNDFSSWVKDVFYENSLADDLKLAKSKMEAQVAVLRRLVKELM